MTGSRHREDERRSSRPAHQAEGVNRSSPLTMPRRLIQSPNSGHSAHEDRRVAGPRRSCAQLVQAQNPDSNFYGAGTKPAWRPRATLAERCQSGMIGRRLIGVRGHAGALPEPGLTLFVFGQRLPCAASKSIKQPVRNQRLRSHPCRSRAFPCSSRKAWSRESLPTASD